MIWVVAIGVWMMCGLAAISLTGHAEYGWLRMLQLLGGPGALVVAFFVRRCPECDHPLHGRYCSNPIRPYGYEEAPAEACSRESVPEPAVMRWMNWERIRVIGELHILNRVSYVVLAVAPLLAVLWVGIRGQIVTFNNKGLVIAENLKGASLALQQDLQNLSDLNGRIDARRSSVTVLSKETNELRERLRTLTVKLEGLEGSINQFITDQKTKQPDTNFPEVLTLSYFAALILATAHFLYQSAAPKIIRHYTSDEYAASEVERFARNQGSEEQLHQALTRIYRHDLAFYKKSTTGPPRQPTRMEGPEGVPDKFSVIERAAQLDYEFARGLHPFVAFVTSLTYLLGIGLIGWITFLQIRMVLIARGVIQAT